MFIFWFLSRTTQTNKTIIKKKKKEKHSKNHIENTLKEEKRKRNQKVNKVFFLWLAEYNLKLKCVLKDSRNIELWNSAGFLYCFFKCSYREQFIRVRLHIERANECFLLLTVCSLSLSLVLPRFFLPFGVQEECSQI